MATDPGPNEGDAGLGPDDGITRRDFLDGVAITAAGLMAAADGGRRLATPRRLGRGRGERESAEFLAGFRVHDKPHDRWITKDEDPELWFALLPEHVESPFRSVVRVS